MKVFLSHGMHGVSEEKILKLREEMRELVKKSFPDEQIEIIDNYHHDDAPEGAGRLWHLGRSIQMMGDADLVVFCRGQGAANGVIIEGRICRLYGIKHLYCIDDRLWR